MLHFKKAKITKNTCKYHYQDLDDMIYRSWDIEQDKLKLVILGHFFSLNPHKSTKNQTFEKSRNLLEIFSFYKCTPKISIIWCTVPEIRSKTDTIFGHFGPFFSLLPHLYDPENKIFEKKWKKCQEINNKIINDKVNEIQNWNFRVRVTNTVEIKRLEYFSKDLF